MSCTQSVGPFGRSGMGISCSARNGGGEGGGGTGVSVNADSGSTALRGSSIRETPLRTLKAAVVACLVRKTRRLRPNSQSQSTLKIGANSSTPGLKVSKTKQCIYSIPEPSLVARLKGYGMIDDARIIMKMK